MKNELATVFASAAAVFITSLINHVWVEYFLLVTLVKLTLIIPWEPMGGGIYMYRSNTFYLLLFFS